MRPVLPAEGRPTTLAERAALSLEVLAAYAFVRRELSRREFPDAVAAVRGTPARVQAGGDAAALGRRLGAAAIRVLRVLPTDSRCLMRSLVLLRLLARRGIDAQLVLGVRGAGDFAAHAWVEHEHVALLATGGGAFDRLVEL